MEKACQWRVCRLLQHLCHLPEWTADLSNLLFRSVLPFTAIEGKCNSLGKVFRIHRGETVGFP